MDCPSLSFSVHSIMRGFLLTICFISLSFFVFSYRINQYYSISQGTHLYVEADETSEKLKKLDKLSFVRHGYMRNTWTRKVSTFLDPETGDSISTGWRFVKTIDNDSGYVMFTYMTLINDWGNVAAHEGLFIRKGPSAKETAIGKAQAGNLIQILGHVASKDTRYPETWAMVYHQELGIGFVYSPFILSGFSTADRDACGDELAPGLSFGKGNIRFHNYCVYEEERKSKDTLFLGEHILQMARNHIISLTLDEDVDSAQVFFHPTGGIREQFNPYLNADYEKWAAEPRIALEPEIPYMKLQGLNGFYRIPDFKDQLHDNMSTGQVKELGISDTLSDMSGESENIAYIQIDGKPCNDYVAGCTFKIVLFINKRRVIKYVTLGFEFGC